MLSIYSFKDIQAWRFVESNSMKDAKWWREYRKKNRDRLRIYDRERKRRNRKPKEEVKPSEEVK